jgi:hypothetical protein
MLVIVTGNPTTAARGGASVPTTNTEPPFTLDWVPLVSELVQPATASTIAATGTSASLNSIVRILGDIFGYVTFCGLPKLKLRAPGEAFFPILCRKHRPVCEPLPGLTQRI